MLIVEHEPFLPYEFPDARDIIALRGDPWVDGESLQALFQVFLIVTTDGNEREFELGPIKIARLGQMSGSVQPDLPAARLSPNFASLGQDPDYYEQLAALPERKANSVLYALRDISKYPTIEKKFRAQASWKQSLVRFGQAESALELGQRLFPGQSDSQPKRQAVARNAVG